MEAAKSVKIWDDRIGGRRRGIKSRSFFFRIIERFQGRKDKTEREKERRREDSNAKVILEYKEKEEEEEEREL